MNNSKTSCQTWGEKLKLEVLSHYSNTPVPFCVVCGYNNILALSLDHINNDGNDHRRELTKCSHERSRGGLPFYSKLKKLGYPKDRPIQVLCMNCQTIKNHTQGLKEYYKRKKESNLTINVSTP